MFVGHFARRQLEHLSQAPKHVGKLLFSVRKSDAKSTFSNPAWDVKAGSRGQSREALSSIRPYIHLQGANSALAAAHRVHAPPGLRVAAARSRYIRFAYFRAATHRRLPDIGNQSFSFGEQHRINCQP
jgi:hypothetical protein